MRQAQFLGGILLMGAAALFFFASWDVPVPVPIALLVVGIALVAISRRRR